MTFQDLNTVHTRMRDGGFYRRLSSDPAPGWLTYLAAVGCAARREGHNVSFASLIRYGAEWFGVPEPEFECGIKQLVQSCGYLDIETWWEWVTTPTTDRRESN